MNIKITAARIIIVRELSTGPKTWGQLLKAYYGEARAKLNVNTSFWNKKKECIVLDIMRHDPVTKSYHLGEVGQQFLDYCRANNVNMNVKSEAQLKFEAEHPLA
jgi:hypothetical protein